MRKLVATLALLSCTGAHAQTPPPADGVGVTPPLDIEVTYNCPGGPDFSAVYTKDGDLVTIQVPGQPEIELSRQQSGSGFAYGDSYYELRGKGREATLTAAGRSMRCHAVGRPGEPPRTYAGSGLTVTLLPDGTFRLRDTRDGSVDLGQWDQEVEGGVRLVLRGGAVLRRAFREAGGDRLIAPDGTELSRTAQVDPIDTQFRLSGMYRDTQSGGLFAECATGRTYAVAPGRAEPDLEKAWTEQTQSRESQLFAKILGRVAGTEIQVDQVLSLTRTGGCPARAPRGSALRDTEWRVVEIDGDRLQIENWRERPLLRLDDKDRYSGTTGCNSIAGTIRLDPDGLQFTRGAVTMMACSDEANARERRFLDALDAVRHAQVAGTTLDLLDASGKRRLRLEARGS